MAQVCVVWVRCVSGLCWAMDLFVKEFPVLLYKEYMGKKPHKGENYQTAKTAQYTHTLSGQKG